MRNRTTPPQANTLTHFLPGLIAYKLWATDRNVRVNGVMSGPSVGHRVMIILVESAAIYSTMHLLYAILYLIKSNVETTPSYLVCRLHLSHCAAANASMQEASVASITCSMIITRCEGVFRGDSTSPRSFPNFSPRVERWQSHVVSVESGTVERESVRKPENMPRDELYVMKEFSQ